MLDEEDEDESPWALPTKLTTNTDDRTEERVTAENMSNLR